MTRFLGWLLLYIYHLFWAIQGDRPGLPWLHCKGFPEMHSEPCREAGSMGNFSHEAHTKLSTITDESSLMQFMTFAFVLSESPQGAGAAVGVDLGVRQLPVVDLRGAGPRLGPRLRRRLCQRPLARQGEESQGRSRNR